MIILLKHSVLWNFQSVTGISDLLFYQLTPGFSCREYCWMNIWIIMKKWIFSFSCLLIF